MDTTPLGQSRSTPRFSAGAGVATKTPDAIVYLRRRPVKWSCPAVFYSWLQGELGADPSPARIQFRWAVRSEIPDRLGGLFFTSIFHAHVFLARELQIGFVHESRRVERRTPVRAAKMVARDEAELVIDERNELIESVAISAGIGALKLGDGIRFSHVRVETTGISREAQPSQELGPTAIIRACSS